MGSSTIADVKEIYLRSKSERDIYLPRIYWFYCFTKSAQKKI